MMSVIEKTAGKKARSKDRGDLVIDSELEATRADLLRSRHLPSKYYTSAEIYELELEKIWRKDWIVVGREEEFPNPGDYRAMNVAGEPVVITRAEDGTLNAFSNICAHRGTEVAYGEGNTKDFSCPYHAWLYGLKGELIKATRTGPIEGFDLSNCRLPEVKLDTWGGFIFINFDDSPPALTDYLDADTVRSEMDFLRMDELRLVDTYSFELDCNWKLI
ncbi:MAG: Rieske (2Fe-2S) protein, partial [Pseudomonadales bacterium]